MKNLKFLLFALFVFSACKSDKGGEQPKETQVVESPQSAQVEALGLPPLPKEIVMRMYDKVELLDYIFHDLPFSMNQAEKPSIQANISYIARDGVDAIPSNCKPMARQFYQIEGNIEYEADIYFSDSCKFYVFYVDGKKAYANKMAQPGIDFFNMMISRALESSKSVNGR